MTPEQQAAETAEFLAAYCKSGLDVAGEWKDGKGRCRLEYVGAGWVRVRWVPSSVEYSPSSGRAEPYSDHEAASLILRSIQRELDEAGVVVSQDCERNFFVQSFNMFADDPEWLWRVLVDGEWEMHDRPTLFVSRPLAMLAAYVAAREENQ